MKYTLKIGWDDLLTAISKNLNMSITLSWMDIQQGYHRSRLGPFWITISMAITVLGMGLVFGLLFGTPLRDFLPFLALGMIIWAFITAVISEGCTTFINSHGIIKQIAMPLYSHIFRMVCRNIIIFGHNFLIFPVVMLVFLKSPNINVFMFFPGMVVLVANLMWIAMVNAVICTRYRDVTQIVVSILQLCFFVTPIIWQPELMIQKGRSIIMEINPFYHLIEIIRAPLLGQLPSGLNWAVCVGLLVVGWPATLMLLGHYKKRVSYWL